MKIINTQVGPKGSALPLSAAIEINGLLYLSGQISVSGGVVVGDDITAQTQQVFDNIEQVLAQEGLGLDNIVKLTVWLTDATLFPEFNAAYTARLKAPYPVRSTVISGLAVADTLIEMEAVAARDARRQ